MIVEDYIWLIACMRVKNNATTGRLIYELMVSVRIYIISIH